MIIGGLIIGLAGIYFVATWLVPQALVTLTKAAPTTKVSLVNSLIIGDKILARADGKDSCVVNVFLMDSGNKGVSNKRVDLNAGTGKVVIKPLGGVTNADGRATFEITSETEGQVQITAKAEGVALPRGLTITFRNF